MTSEVLNVTDLLDEKLNPTDPKNDSLTAKKKFANAVKMLFYTGYTTRGSESGIKKSVGFWGKQIVAMYEGSKNKPAWDNRVLEGITTSNVAGKTGSVKITFPDLLAISHAAIGITEGIRIMQSPWESKEVVSEGLADF